MNTDVSCLPDKSAPSEITRYLKKTTNQILSHLGHHTSSISILLTNDEIIRNLNATYRNINKPTNVLSFPLNEEFNFTLGSAKHEELGDIVISLDTARRESAAYNQSLLTRLKWLLVHGILHLLSYDHEKSKNEAEKMKKKEDEILSHLHTIGSKTMPHLAINVDHVATIRQARGGVEPDPVSAAAICEMAGASGIVVHLREDRRHIQDRDLYLLKETIKTKLNLEMGANKEIIEIALDINPDMVTLVPEKRQELTTEGGLDVLSQKKKIAKAIKQFSKKSIPVSIFIDPDIDQIKTAHDIGAKFVEIHTGRYCDATTEDTIDHEFSLIAQAAEEAYSMGLTVNGGHGLDYHNTGRIAALDTIDELSIGHAVISRSVFSGLEQAVRDMLSIIKNAQIHNF